MFLAFGILMRLRSRIVVHVRHGFPRVGRAEDPLHQARAPHAELVDVRIGRRHHHEGEERRAHETADDRDTHRRTLLGRFVETHRDRHRAGDEGQKLFITII